MTLQGKAVALGDVTLEQRENMYRLMVGYYAGMRRNIFEQDLDQKDWVIQITDCDTGRLLGFSTQVLWKVDSGQGPSGILFSGDTIMERRHWGNNPLAQTWGRFALDLIDEHERKEIPLYWFLIVKGYKTYRFLPLFFHEFFPTVNSATPPWAIHLINELGTTRFPTLFDIQNGVIRSAHNGCRLRAGVADITSSRLRDPHVRFFAARNPGHACGNELCCIAPLSRDNFTPAARRVIGTIVFSSTVDA